MMNRLTDTVKHLIIINVVIFIGTMAIGGGTLLYEWLALYFPQSETFQPWQIFTHMFMHGGFGHLFFNMFALFMFGVAVEQYLGNKKFLFLYISAGLGAVLFQLGYYYFNYIPTFSELEASGLSSESIIQMLKSNKTVGVVSPEQISQLQSIFPVYNASMVGASGCIMGVMVAFAMMNPNAELMLIFLPIPIKAKYFIPGIIILDLISAISGQSFFSPSNTAYMAHVGGAVTGFLIMWYWRKTEFNKNRWN